MLRTLFRQLNITTKLGGGDRKAKLQAMRDSQKVDLPKLQLRKVPYFRKGTKLEQRQQHNAAKKRDPVMNNRLRLNEPNSIMIEGDYFGGQSEDFELTVHSIGDDAVEYTALNWMSDDPAWMSRTALADLDENGNVTHLAAAIAMRQVQMMHKTEALCTGAGAGYRFRERPHDKKRRLARVEAKRLLLDELERKKVSLITNQVFMQRDYPLRPWARPPQSLKQKLRGLAHEDSTATSGDQKVAVEHALRIREELVAKAEAAQALIEKTEQSQTLNKEEQMSQTAKVRTITSEKDIEDLFDL